jgi:MFS family permease
LSNRTTTLFLVGLRLLVLNLTYFFLPLYLREAGVTGFWNGFLLAMFAVTAFLSAFQTGIFTDRYPIRFLAAAGFLLMAAFEVAVPRTSGLAALTAVFLVGGLGNTLLEISLSAYVLKTVDDERPGRWFGAYYTTQGLTIGGGILAGGQLVSLAGYAVAFDVAAAAFLVAAVVALRLADTHRTRVRLAEYATHLAARDAVWITAGFFLLSLHWGAEITSVAPFLRDDLALEPSGTGIYMGAALTGLALAAYVSGVTFDRGVPLRRLATVGLLLSGLGHVAMTVPWALASWAIRFLHEAGDGASGVVLFLLLHRVFPRERVGGLASFVATATIVGRLLGTLVFAPMGEAFGFRWPLVVSGLLTVVAILPLWGVLQARAVAAPSRILSEP